MNDRQRYYLKQLGIKPWVLRHPIQTSQTGILTISDESNNDSQINVSLEKLTLEVEKCTRCILCKTRTQTVFARGNPRAKLMIIGEAPGFHEDKQGLPFVGKAGGLLNRMLNSIGLDEDKVYIANVIKCRPPDNRDPTSAEIEQCSGYLAQQISLVNPKLILALGRFAGQFLLKQVLTMGKMRLKIHSYQDKPVLVSYHPAYLLRNPADKKKAYQDLTRVIEHLNAMS